MRIQKFHIQGFKSIADLTVEGLSDINIFFGLNDVGKSNIFEALRLWQWAITAESSIAYPLPSPSGELPGFLPKGLLSEFGPAFRRLGYEGSVRIGVVIDEYAPKSLEIEIDRSGSLFRQEILSLPGFHVIDATRRLQGEDWNQETPLSKVSYANLKRSLFFAHNSSDYTRKRQLNAIKRILAEPPFDFGELDVAINPETNRIDIGFIRSDGRLPVENLGTGAQQLLLILGQVFLNDYPIIALEEPEMNLSPRYQEYLMAALRKLMREPAVKLRQLFISTHSPYFEFAENFYDVTFDAENGTQVVRATQQRHARHFAVTPTGPETGARLNSLNQIQLYQGVLDDLHLQRGDMLFFVKGEAGRWEIYPEGEVLEAMKDAWGDDGSDE